MHSVHTLVSKLGTTLNGQWVLAQVVKPGVFALMGVAVSSIGLLIPAHKLLLAKVTFFGVGEVSISSTLGPASRRSFLGVGLVSRNIGDGARAGATGAS